MMRSKTDIRKADIVLVAEQIIPRGQWHLGRVIEVNVGRDRHVRSYLIKLRTSRKINLMQFENFMGGILGTVTSL